ncbi:hypothetical protein BJF90_36895 [Pseudonocardia sp. CNS-004]|nr:hypothetical protein BJF90_36895 [Pseudonocardia sp. CNS-004]
MGCTGSYVVRSPSSWSTDTTLLAPTGPANTTVPSRAARTAWPTEPTRSTPRWPRPYGCGGARNRSPIAGTGGSGQAYLAPGAGIPAPSGGAGSSSARGGACAAGPVGRSGREASARATGAPGVGAAASSIAEQRVAMSARHTQLVECAHVRRRAGASIGPE